MCLACIARYTTVLLQYLLLLVISFNNLVFFYSNELRVTRVHEYLDLELTFDCPWLYAYYLLTRSIPSFDTAGLPVRACEM